MPNKVKQFLEQASLEKVYIGLKNNSISLKDFVDVVLSKQDCILFGPPGTSKTYYVDKLAEKLGDKVGLFQIIQFHANYSYDEFIDGIVPDIDKGGFKYETGVFYNFCQEAQNPPNKEKICVFVIDEINRANVTSVFGEVMNLIENKGVRIMKTAKQRKIFFVPDNVVIVGTMNTADKTLAKLDFALRRRFRFLPVYPSKYALHEMIAACGFDADINISVDDYVDCFEILNSKIRRNNQLGKEMMIGHVLWTRRTNSLSLYTVSDIGSIFRESIFPQLESYCGANRDLLGNLVGTAIRDKLVYRYAISDDEILNYLSILKNSKAGENNVTSN